MERETGILPGPRAAPGAALRQNSGMNVVAWLDRAARADPARVAILRGAARWATYGELAARVARLAAGLR